MPCSLARLIAIPMSLAKISTAKKAKAVLNSEKAKLNTTVKATCYRFRKAKKGKTGLHVEKATKNRVLTSISTDSAKKEMGLLTWKEPKAKALQRKKDSQKANPKGTKNEQLAIIYGS